MLLGVDPGATTGWSLWAISDDGHPELISSGQVLTWHGLASIMSGDVTTVVMEAFRLFPQRAKEQIGSDFPAVQVIGVVRYLCEERGIEVVLKPAGDKEFFDDGKLERSGFMPYERGQRHRNRHALDSVRHVLHYLHFTRHVHITYA